MRTILFNTSSHLGRNAAIIVAWIVMSCGTMTLFTWLVRVIEHRRRTRALKRVGSKTDFDPSVAEKGKGKAVSRDTDSLKGSAKGARNGVGKGAGKPGSKPPSVKGSSKPGSVKSTKSASIKEKSRKTKAEVREKSVD